MGLAAGGLLGHRGSGAWGEVVRCHFSIESGIHTVNKRTAGFWQAWTARIVIGVILAMFAAAAGFVPLLAGRVGALDVMQAKTEERMDAIREDLKVIREDVREIRRVVVDKKGK